VENGAFVIASGGQVTFNCKLAESGDLKGPINVKGATTNPAGWNVQVDGQSVLVQVRNVGAQSPFTVTITAANCTAGATATIKLDFFSPSVGNPKLEHFETFGFRCKAPITATAPTVGIEPFNFIERTWDGYTWGTTTGLATLTINRANGGDLGSYDIQVQVKGSSVPGLNPTVSSSTTDSANVSATTITGNPNIAPVKVARVAPGFNGTGRVDVTFSLSPTNDVPEGLHNVTIEVSVVTGS
jgi:hypothetical protein